MTWRKLSKKIEKKIFFIAMPIREAILKKKTLLLFGHCQNCLDPPPLFLDTKKEPFILTGKSAEIFFIWSNFRQKSASTVFGLGSTPPPPPLKRSKSKQKKRCLKQFGFWLDPPPLPKLKQICNMFFGRNEATRLSSLTAFCQY